MFFHVRVMPLTGSCKIWLKLAKGMVMKLVMKLAEQMVMKWVMQPAERMVTRLVKVWLVPFFGLLLWLGYSSHLPAERTWTVQGCDWVHFIYIGNPGTGKTTLLNTQHGGTVLESGVGVGGGMTRGLHCVPQDQTKTVLCDTPGLNDPWIRREAAGNITQGLKKGGCFKVFFVVKLESGRVRPEDTTTMKLVLESAPIKEDEYSIIINQVKELEHKKIKEKWAHLRDTLLLGMPVKTNSTHVIISLPELEDKDNATMTNEQAKRGFERFLRSAPTVWMDQKKVMDIMIQDYEKTIQVLTDNLTRVERQAQNAEEQMRDSQNKIMELESEKSFYKGLGVCLCRCILVCLLLCVVVCENEVWRMRGV